MRCMRPLRSKHVLGARALLPENESLVPVSIGRFGKLMSTRWTCFENVGSVGLMVARTIRTVNTTKHENNMGRKKTTRGILLAANLPQLQNLIKRDPEGYREEV